MTRQKTIAALMNSVSAPAITLAAITLGVMALCVQPAFAARGDDDKAQVTVGTRVEGRTAADLPVAVDIISQSAIERSGAVDISGVLQTLSTSFNAVPSTPGDGTDILRTASLRGMGPDQVLVLINGKRRHTSAWINNRQQVGRGTVGTDFSAIPVSAIGRVEILRDGATARYGSGALAGVVNVELKNHVDGIRFTSQTGQTYAGDGQTLFAALNAGAPFGQEGGFINIAIEYRDQGRTDRARPSLRLGKTIYELGEPTTTGWATFANMVLPLGDNAEFYAFGGTSYREGHSGGFYRWPEQASRSVPGVYPGGYLPVQTTGTSDRSFAAGYKRSFDNGWHVDLSLVRGSNEFEFGVENSINVSLASDPAFAGTGPREGNSGTLEFNQTTLNMELSRDIKLGDKRLIHLTLGQEYRSDAYKIKEGDYASWACGSFGEAAVAIPSVTDPLQAAACGFQGFAGYGPSAATDIKRGVKGFYLDAETEISKNWLVTTLLRYEDYETIGEALAAKLATRFDLSRQFSVHGSLSKEFRAPDLVQAGFTENFKLVNGPALDEALHAPQASAWPALYGAGALDHETSLNYSLGALWQPAKTFYFKFDFFQVEVDDRIVVTGSLDGTGNPAAAAALAAAGLQSVQFYTNGIDTRSRGLDMTVHSQGGFFGGEIGVTGLLGINHTEVTAIAPLMANTFNKAQVDLVETGQPRQRYGLKINWDKSKFSHTLQFNYFGSVETSFWTAGNLGLPAATGVDMSQTIYSSPRTVVDYELGYALTRRFEFAVGVKNLFDKFPDELAKNSAHALLTENQAGSFGNSLYPWEATPFGTIGAQYYVKAAVKF